MTRSRAIAWSLFALWLLLSATGAVLSLSHGDLFDGFLWIALLVTSSAGLILALRVPGNPVGWLILVGAVLIAVSAALDGYASGSGDPASLPGGRLAIWVGSWLHFVWLGLIAFCVPIVFPGGRPASRRWKVFLWAGAGVAGVAIAGTALGEPVMEWDSDLEIANPLHLPGAAGPPLEVAATVGEVLFALAVLTGAAGLVARLRRARGLERQQLKWFALTGSVMLVGLAAAGGGETFGAPDLVGNAGYALFLLGLVVGLPLSIAIAILRYRLYDIDVVIRRTVTYGALTAALAGCYLGLVLPISLAVGDSDLAVAGSTLAVAALFRPLRARIQALVDRRFFRSRYDAALTLAGFGTRLRDEVELESVSGELRAVVAQTLRPAHVSLWLREVER